MFATVTSVPMNTFSVINMAEVTYTDAFAPIIASGDGMVDVNLIGLGEVGAAPIRVYTSGAACGAGVSVTHTAGRPDSAVVARARTTLAADVAVDAAAQAAAVRGFGEAPFHGLVYRLVAAAVALQSGAALPGHHDLRGANAELGLIGQNAATEFYLVPRTSRLGTALPEGALTAMRCVCRESAGCAINGNIQKPDFVASLGEAYCYVPGMQQVAAAQTDAASCIAALAWLTEVVPSMAEVVNRSVLQVASCCGFTLTHLTVGRQDYAVRHSTRAGFDWLCKLVRDGFFDADVAGRRRALIDMMARGECLGQVIADAQREGVANAMLAVEVNGHALGVASAVDLAAEWTGTQAATDLVNRLRAAVGLAAVAPLPRGAVINRAKRYAVGATANFVVKSSAGLDLWPGIVETECPTELWMCSAAELVKAVAYAAISMRCCADFVFDFYGVCGERTVGSESLTELLRISAQTGGGAVSVPRMVLAAKDWIAGIWQLARYMATGCPEYQASGVARSARFQAWPEGVDPRLCDLCFSTYQKLKLMPSEMIVDPVYNLLAAGPLGIGTSWAKYMADERDSSIRRRCGMCLNAANWDGLVFTARERCMVEGRIVWEREYTPLYKYAYDMIGAERTCVGLDGYCAIKQISVSYDWRCAPSLSFRGGAATFEPAATVAPMRLDTYVATALAGVMVGHQLQTVLPIFSNLYYDESDQVLSVEKVTAQFVKEKWEGKAMTPGFTKIFSA